MFGVMNIVIIGPMNLSISIFNVFLGSSFTGTLSFLIEEHALIYRLFCVSCAENMPIFLHFKVIRQAMNYKKLDKREQLEFPTINV